MLLPNSLIMLFISSELQAPVTEKPSRIAAALQEAAGHVSSATQTVMLRGESSSSNDFHGGATTSGYHSSASRGCDGLGRRHEAPCNTQEGRRLPKWRVQHTGRPCTHQQRWQLTRREPQMKRAYFPNHMIITLLLMLLRISHL